MSRTTTAARRIALLASSSFGLAAIASVASLGAALTPTAAYAVNECTPIGVDPAANGATADSYTCAAATYSPGGITYNSSGDLTVSTSGTSSMPVGQGIDLNGFGADDVTFNNGAVSGTGVVTVGRQLTGATGLVVGLDVTTEAGDIVIVQAARANLNSSTTTHAIRAISTQGGSVSVTTANFVSATSGIAGIEAVSQGGNGNVSVVSPSDAIGRLIGIRAQASGSGTLTINGVGRGNSTGGVGVDATSGTGLLSFTGAGVANVVDGIGVRLNAGGNVVFNGSGLATTTNNNTTGIGAQINAGGNIQFTGTARGGLYGLDLTLASGKTATINTTGEFDITQPNFYGNTAAIRAQGAGNLVVNITSGAMRGGLDLSGLTATSVLNVADGAAWMINNPTPMSSVNGVTINAAEGSRIFWGIYRDSSDSKTISMDFTGAQDVVNLDGTLNVNAFLKTTTDLTGRGSFQGQTTAVGLEEFHNSGTIAMGGLYHTQGSQLGGETDLAADDILSMPGARYVGHDGRLILDVNLNGGSTTNCNAANRDADGNMPSDCLSIIDGSTEGTTYVTIRDQLPGDRGAYNPDGIVLVDVSGSGAGGAQGDFVLAEDSDGYDGGIIDKGAFAYLIAYDEEAQKHSLVGLPSSNTLQLALLPSISQGLWRTSTGAWLDRQADLRGDLHDGVGGGIWLRVSTDFAERDAVQSVSGGGQTFSFDNTFTQNGYAVTGGFDLLAGQGGDTAYVAGVMVGYAHTDVEYDESPNKARFDGASLGGYASLVSGGLFVDAAVNVNRLDLEQDIPAYDLFPAGTLVSSTLMQTGVEVQAGWRFPLANGLFVEPLAGVSYVQSEYDDVNIVSDDPARPGVDATFEDAVSLRASLGGRIALEQDYGPVRAQYSLLGRVWEEFDGEAVVTLANVGPDAIISDEFSDQLSEFGVSANFSGLGGMVSGFFNLGGKFGDDYQSQNISTGVRVNW